MLVSQSWVGGFPEVGDIVFKFGPWEMSHKPNGGESEALVNTHEGALPYFRFSRDEHRTFFFFLSLAGFSHLNAVSHVPCISPLLPLVCRDVNEGTE